MDRRHVEQAEYVAFAAFVVAAAVSAAVVLVGLVALGAGLGWW